LLQRQATERVRLEGLSLVLRERGLGSSTSHYSHVYRVGCSVVGEQVGKDNSGVMFSVLYGILRHIVRLSCRWCNSGGALHACVVEGDLESSTIRASFIVIHFCPILTITRLVS
jgi:hypothetical protein